MEPHDLTPQESLYDSIAQSLPDLLPHQGFAHDPLNQTYPSWDTHGAYTDPESYSYTDTNHFTEIPSPLADYDPHHFLHGAVSGQPLDHLEVHSLGGFDLLDHGALQRSGFSGFTPSSPSDIQVNKEVTFTDGSGHSQEGTVLDVGYGGDTYKVQTSDATYENVPYHDIQSYRSK